jgi:hypothetical protein
MVHMYRKGCKLIGNHNSVHFIGQEKEIPDGTEVVPKISLWSAVLNINSGNLINYCPTRLNKKTSLKSVVQLIYRLCRDRIYFDKILVSE